jgi:N-acetylmuramoyl-L-alanine amidase
MKVYLNPGHDREVDSGAVKAHLEVRECDLAYDLGCLVKERLERNGIAVVLGQNDDLYAVCDEANQEEVDVFVSIHFNAFNTRATGTETLVSGTANSLMLGHCIQSNIKAVLCLPDRGLKERPGLFVLRNTAMPAVLAEVCFVDNDYDIKRYMGRAEEVASAIATGILPVSGHDRAASGISAILGKCMHGLMLQGAGKKVYRPQAFCSICLQLYKTDIIERRNDTWQHVQLYPAN